MMYQEVIQWLLEGDPAIQYQVHRDLLDSPREELDMEQMYMEINEGWCNTLLSKQDEFGSWSEHIIDPHWKGTIWALTLLRRLGLSHSVVEFQLGGRIIFEKGQRMDGGYNYNAEERDSEVCLSALILANLSYLKIKDPKRDAILEFLIESQMDDGGWSCARKRGGEDSVFSTTLIVLEALEEYKKVDKKNLATIDVMVTKGEEFLLKHHLFRYVYSKEVMEDSFLDFTFPSRWSYNILDALDYFQRTKHRYDERFEAAVEYIKSKKEEDKWKISRKIPGEYWQGYEEEGFSRMLTLKAMLVLRWWNKISKYKFK